VNPSSPHNSTVPSQLAERLRALEDGVTKGPWFHVGLPWMDVAGYVWTREDPHGGYCAADCSESPKAAADAAFVATSRNLFPSLIALVEAAEQLASETYVPHVDHPHEAPVEYDVELLAPSSATVERVLAALAAIEASLDRTKE
jgi:hypothetical protein